jgi:hypothetical protein
MKLVSEILVRRRKQCTSNNEDEENTGAGNPGCSTSKIAPNSYILAACYPPESPRLA